MRGREQRGLLFYPIDLVETSRYCLIMTIKQLTEKYLSERAHRVGETVQFGWFIFKIAEEGNLPRIESLDFREMASYTQDFSEVERIHELQTATLAQFEEEECPCSLVQPALVSVSYYPGHPDAFLKRDESANDKYSGWYVGIDDDELDMDDAASFKHQSLYELTIRDMRMAPYWLLPPDTVISLSGEV